MSGLKGRKAGGQPQRGAAALEWILLVVAAAGMVAIVLILYISSQPTHLAPLR